MINHKLSQNKLKMRKSQQGNRSYKKKEPNENYRTEKYNCRNKKVAKQESKLEMAEVRINELEDMSIEFIQYEQQKKTD